MSRNRYTARGGGRRGAEGRRGGRGRGGQRGVVNSRGRGGGQGRAVQEQQRSADRGGLRGSVQPQQRSEVQHRNGEKGAEAHTVSEVFRIQLSNVLLDLRDDDSKTSVEFPSTLTNTERKFVHLLASQLGLKSKSSGKGENRKITVSKTLSQHTATIGRGSESFQKLQIGGDGQRALSDHLTRFPPSQVESAESKQTGTGLLEKDAQDALWQQCNISIKPDDFFSQFEKCTDTKQRRINHQNVQQKRRQSKAFASMERSRSKLPAWSHRSEIVDVVAENQVTIIVGETGCGKSTQVPQFLLDANPESYICVTQPRRIAAISIADRIAYEQCDETLVAHQVRLENNVTADTQLVLCTPGVLLRKLQSSPILKEYSHIVLDEIHERDRYQEFLLIILRDLLPSRPDLRLVLMSATLQTVDISKYFETFQPATVEMKGRMFPVQEFFLEDVLSITGFVDGVTTELEESQVDGRQSDVTIQCVVCGKIGFASAQELGEHIAFCYGSISASDNEREDSSANALESGVDDKEAERSTVFDDYDVDKVAPGNPHYDAEKHRNDDTGVSKIRCKSVDVDHEKWDGEAAFVVSRPSEEPATRAEELLLQYQTMHDDETVDYFLLVELIRHIVDRGDGGILVFLPGWQEISELSSVLESIAPFSDTSLYSILSLHSGIHSSEQRKVLQRPASGVRKIVLSTNIAETSLTIDDIVFVIDSGRAKEKNYDPHLKTSTLQTTWISKASAKQRKGRAGRVRSGICFHLFSKLRHEALRPFTESELLRTPLEDICLVCKQLSLAPGGQSDHDGIPAFLAKAMNPPHEKSVSNALELLVDLCAMQSDSNDLTPLGECLAVLSLEPRVGKMMIWSYLLGCSRVAVNMSVAMTTKSPFVLPKEAQRRAAESAKVQLSKASESDQLTVHFSLEQKARIRGRNAFMDFCRRNFINATTVQMISDLRQNLFRELGRLNFPNPKDSAYNRHDNDPALWQAAIAAGLYPNIAFRTKDQTNFTTMDKHKVKIHVSSVNAAKGQTLSKKCTANGVEFVCFGEIVKGDRLFTANQTTHLRSPLPLLLLCGTQLCVRPDGANHDISVLSVDDWIVFECDSEIAGQLIILRRRLNSAFWNIISFGSLNGLNAKEIDAVNTLDAVLISAHREAVKS